MLERAIAIKVSGEPADTPVNSGEIVSEWVVVPMIISFSVGVYDHGISDQGYGYTLSIYFGTGQLTFWYRYKRDADAIADQIKLALEDYYNKEDN